MKATEFIELVKRMRKAQKYFFSLSPRDVERKTEAMINAKKLEHQVDHAEVEDPASLKIDFFF